MNSNKIIFSCLNNIFACYLDVGSLHKEA